jgi:hypothetical protein
LRPLLCDGRKISTSADCEKVGVIKRSYGKAGLEGRGAGAKTPAQAVITATVERNSSVVHQHLVERDSIQTQRGEQVVQNQCHLIMRLLNSSSRCKGTWIFNVSFVGSKRWPMSWAM